MFLNVQILKPMLGILIQNFRRLAGTWRSLSLRNLRSRKVKTFAQKPANSLYEICQITVVTSFVLFFV